MVLASGGVVVEGRGSSRGLSLRGLLRFAFRSSLSTPPSSSSFPCACSSHLHMAPFTNLVGSESMIKGRTSWGMGMRPSKRSKDG